MADINIIPGSLAARLIKQGIITPDNLQEALEIQKTNKQQLIGSILVRLGYCTEEDVARALAEKANTNFVSIDEIGVNIAVANLITPEFAMRENVLPLYEEDGIVYVAMKNPNNILVKDNLRLITGHVICPVRREIWSLRRLLRISPI